MSKHNQAILAFREGRVAEALRLLGELLAANESSELWNDWAAIQVEAGFAGKAEDGFTRALELDPQNTDATANLGLLLLGRGDSARAIPLLKKVLPALPPGQQSIVKELLAGQTVDKPISRDTPHSEERKLRILVINDSFPDPQSDARGPRVLQMLRALREEGDDVTFVAREAENGKQCEPLLHQAGIRVYKSDPERLPCLGREADGPAWCFRELVEQTRFDLAVLIHSFRRSISVPEHYLDELRHYSPETRIAIFADELPVAIPRNDEKSLLEFERAENLANRQWEVFERADLVLVSREDDVTALRRCRPDLLVELIPHYIKTVSLAGTRRRILALTPKARAGPCSVLQVETVFSDRLSARTGDHRLLGQLECYVRLAEQLLSEANPEKAREQVRHIFGRAPGFMRHGYFASQVFIVLKGCYRKLGDMNMAERCGSEARRQVVVQAPLVVTSSDRQSTTLFSVIVPTYNRLPILRKCLAALEAQTLPSTDFEVVVIDDGSSDGTEELLTQYRPGFGFQYLRQKNSGTGAARRNGVAHASGEFLLLMNDDTICDRDALKQHLRVQRTYASERWAVLGNFEYPAAARKRALTRYFSVEPFMFPQVSMEEGCPYGYSHLITCNLSVRRSAVVEAGSFDSTYKLSEDTELGIRLYERGYRVLYHPDAHAFHDHLPYPARNLVRRARVYGADYFYMFGRHPRVMREWGMPLKLTAMDEENAIRIHGYVEAHRDEVEQALAAVERWDDVDFEPFLTDRPETAASVLSLLRQTVPAIHWFYLFETMLHTMIRELGLTHMAASRPVTHAAQGAGA